MTTRAAIAPTVRHATRINSTTAVFEVCVTSQATWITVTAHDSGTVSYSVAPNTGGVRSGTLTIAAQIVTVTQDENHPPVASDQMFGTDENVPFSGRLTATDSDHDALSFEVVSNGALGTVTILLVAAIFSTRSTTLKYTFPDVSTATPSG